MHIVHISLLMLQFDGGLSRWNIDERLGICKLDREVGEEFVAIDGFGCLG